MPVLSLRPEQDRAQHSRQWQRPRQEEPGLSVGGGVRGQPLETDPREHAARERQQRQALARAESLPREQSEHERDRIVDGVPGIEHAAQQQKQRKREQRLAPGQDPRRRRGGELRRGSPAGPPPLEPHGHRQKQPNQQDQRMADLPGPGRGCAVAGLHGAEQPVHERSVVAEEPPYLPRLEDRRRRRGDRARAREKTTGAHERQRSEHGRRDRRRADQTPAPAPRGERQQHRSDCQQGPLLVGDRQPQGRAAPQRPAATDRAAGGEQHRRHAQTPAQELLGVAEFERAQGQRVCHAHPECQPASEARAPLHAHPG